MIAFLLKIFGLLAFTIFTWAAWELGGEVGYGRSRVGGRQTASVTTYRWWGLIFFLGAMVCAVLLGMSA